MKYRVSSVNIITSGNDAYIAAYIAANLINEKADVAGKETSLESRKQIFELCMSKLP